MNAQMWHYAKDGRQLGPIPWDQLLALKNDGALTATDAVWTEGMNEWQPAQVVKGLFSAEPIMVAAQQPTIDNFIAAADPYYFHQEAIPEYASFLRRVRAYLLDGLICGIAGGVVSAILTSALVTAPANPHAPNPAMLFSQIISIAIAWLYHALMESSSCQATLGKMVCGMKVTDMDGSRVSFGQASGRYFGKFLSAIILCIGFLMASYTEKKQCLHDILADTLVVMTT